MRLVEHRMVVEEIDDKIIKLIQQRMEASKKIFQAKKMEGIEISDQEQEKLVLSRAMDQATELNLDAGAIRDIFKILIKMSLQKQQELQGIDQG
ncbi:MAG: chorismate mutase [Methanotrichaceae archaeon]|nr:chorismate mutase [Methanotrichaceae archaeon]